LIKLVVFDLWQTLAFRDVNYSTTSRMLEETGAKIPKEKFVKLFESSIQTRKWVSKLDAYKNLCKKMGLETTGKNVKRLMEIRDYAEERTKEFGHSVPLLKQLQRQGLKTGLLSNTSVFALKQVRKKTRILDFIDYPVFSFEVGAIKPDKRMFKEVLKRAKCRPEDALMIGDKPNDDVIPAQKIGMNAILFKDSKQLKKDLAKFSIIAK